MGEVLVGRVPVVDRARAVQAYELVLRPRGSGLALVGDAGEQSLDRAAADVIVATAVDVGLAAVVGSRLTMVEVGRPFLTGALAVPFAPEQVLLVVRASHAADPARLDGVRRLTSEGYRVATRLGVGVHPGAGRVQELLSLSAAVLTTLDTAAGPGRAAGTATRVDLAAARALGLPLVATGVDDDAALEAATTAGAVMMQGRRVSEPELVSGRVLGPSRAAATRLVALLAGADVTVDEIEAAVRLDPGLSLRALRAANSAAAGLPRRVSSVREAVLMLGRRTLRSWVLLLALADGGSGEDQHLGTALSRAHLAETLAPGAGADPDVAYTAGLLSALDLLLAMPLDEALAPMQLDEALVEALLHGAGPVGRVLSQVRAVERGDLSDDGPDTRATNRAYLEALAYSLQTCSAVLTA